MKKYLLTSVLSLLFISSNLFSQGLNSISTNDGVNVIAVGDNGNILRSSNGGTTWSKNIFPGYNFKCVSAVDSMVWITSDNGKVFRTKMGNNPLSMSNVTSVAMNSVCVIDPITVFVCGNNGQVYRTTNAGTNWELRNTGLPNSAKLNSISFRTNTEAVAVGDGGIIYTTANAGGQWTAMASPTTRNLLKVKYFATGFVVVGEHGVLLTRYGNEGVLSVNTRIQTDLRGVTGTSFTTVRVCGGGGFIRNNIGSSKFASFEANPMMANLSDIYYRNASIGYAVSSMNDAVIKTVNGGTTWTLTAGATASYSWNVKLTASGSIGNTLCPHPTKRDEMYVVYGRQIYVSRNRGESWTPHSLIQGTGISTSARAHSFYVNPIDTNIMVAAVAGSPTDAVVKSTDHGVTWTISLAKNFSSYGQPLEQDQNMPSRYYFVPDGGGFFRSTDYGSTFTQISTYPFLSPCDIVVMYDSANVLYCGESSPSRVYKSTDSGVNWTLVLTSSGSEIPSIANSVFERGQAYATTFSSPLWKTTNHGDNWSQVYTLSGSGWGSDICREDPNVYLTGTYSGSTGYSTTNAGATFFTSTITSGSGAGIIVMEKAYMLAQQTSNLLKLSVSYNVPTFIQETPVSNSVPTKFDLYQNYPNPFNPATNIKFDLVSNGHVKLKIYNEVGKEVETLLDGVRNAGTYEVRFDASHLGSGVYFYKIETDNATITKKMLLIK